MPGAFCAILKRPLPIITLLFALVLPAFAQPYYIAPDGNDTNPGTLEKPFASLQRAQQAVRQKPGAVFLRGGTYYLPATLVFTAQDSGTKDAPVIFQAYENEKPVISGGVKLENLDWQPYTNGIFQAKVPDDLQTEEIFVNGERQILARYPNFDPTAKYFDGLRRRRDFHESLRALGRSGGRLFSRHAPVALGRFHLAHHRQGCNGQRDDGRRLAEQSRRGGAPADPVRGKYFRGTRRARRMVSQHQNAHAVFLSARRTGFEERATVEATRLRSLVEFRGSETKPVKFVTLRGLTFRQAARTVMDTKEPLVRSDWAIYRGGAIFFNGAEDCALEDSFIDQVGGNAIFVNNYNRRVTVRGCQIAKAGASGICFVGDPQAARSALFNYNQGEQARRH